MNRQCRPLETGGGNITPLPSHVSTSGGSWVKLVGWNFNRANLLLSPFSHRASTYSDRALLHVKYHCKPHGVSSAPPSPFVNHQKRKEEDVGKTKELKENKVR